MQLQLGQCLAPERCKYRVGFTIVRLNAPGFKQQRTVVPDHFDALFLQGHLNPGITLTRCGFVEIVPVDRACATGFDNVLEFFQGSAGTNDQPAAPCPQLFIERCKTVM